MEDFQYYTGYTAYGEDLCTFAYTLKEDGHVYASCLAGVVKSIETFTRETLDEFLSGGGRYKYLEFEVL